MKTFNHAFDIAFEVVSSEEDGSDVTPEMFRSAIEKRMNDLDRFDAWEEAIGAPFDTYPQAELREVAS